MSAVALAVDVPVPLSPTAGAGAFPWPPEDGYWHARKPAGGFALLPVDQLLLPWHAYQHGLLTPMVLRGSLASREMSERRCELEPGTRVHYRARELQELLGPAVRCSQATAVLEALEASGLVTWTEPALRLMTQPTDLQGLDPRAYTALRAHVHPLLYRVPVPRRLLRYLAREGSPGLIATTLGVVLQCVRYFRQEKQCRSGGTLAAAWIARCFGIGERTAYRGLATLEALGWLATCSGLQTKQPRLANKGLFGLALIANKKAVRPTLIANEPILIAKGLQTARQTHIDCEGNNRQEINMLLDFPIGSLVSPI